MPTRPDRHPAGPQPVDRYRPDRHRADRGAGRGVRDPSPVVQWIGWHLAELAGVTGPAVLAVTVTWWFALLTVLVALGWATHEIRQRRHRRAVTSARRQALAGPDENVTARRGDGQASA